MVSTRSRSHLSASSLQTGNEGGDTQGVEVTSKTTAETSKRPTGRSSRRSIAPLEVIAEERPAPRSTRKKASKPVEEAEEQAEVDEGMIDKLAADIFRELDGAFGNTDGEGEGDSSDDSESSDNDDNSEADDDAVDIREEGLRWKPALKLPGDGGDGSSGGQSSKRVEGAAAAAAEEEEDLVADKRGNNLSKMLHVPSADERARARAARKNAPDTAGKDWFDLPATTITEEVKTDLRVLRLRSTFDPKQFYKKFDDTKFPKYFQFGTVIEGAADWRTDRLSQKQRKRTLAEEIMADEHITHHRKKRYAKLQAEGERWAGKSGRKTSNPRLKKKPRKPKH